MTKVKGKVIWVTGASSGVGEALAYELARKGAKLILSSRRKEELERVKGSCLIDAQNNIRILPLDLSKSETLEVSTEAALQFFGNIDILINNAGVSQRSLAKGTGLQVDRRLMEINYFGTIALTKYLLPVMTKSKSGHIVTVSSLVGKFGSPYRSGYAGSKHALHGFFDSLRAELWKDKINITIICLGFIHTKLSVNALTENGKPLRKMDHANKMGMTPINCAKKIIQAVERNKEEVNVGGKETYGVLLKRFFPKIFSRLLRKAKVR